MSELIKAYFIGKDGEDYVTGLLKRNNIGNVISNLYLQYGDKTHQVDILTVTKKGIYVIEVKNMQGKIKGGINTFKWYQSLGRSTYGFYNPIMQNANHIEALRKSWFDRIIYHNIVVFPDDTEIVIDDHTRVKTYSELMTLGLGAPDILTDKEVELLTAELRELKYENAYLATTHDRQQQKFLK